MKVFADGELAGQTRFGYRDFTVAGDHFELNGKPVYILGSNGCIDGDYGWGRRDIAWNKGNYTRRLLQLTKATNMNMARVHSGPVPKNYYDICDELGLIVSEDA